MPIFQLQYMGADGHTSVYPTKRSYICGLKIPGALL